MSEIENTLKKFNRWIAVLPGDIVTKETAAAQSNLIKHTYSRRSRHASMSERERRNEDRGKEFEKARRERRRTKLAAIKRQSIVGKTEDICTRTDH